MRRGRMEKKTKRMSFYKERERKRKRGTRRRDGEMAGGGGVSCDKKLRVEGRGRWDGQRGGRAYGDHKYILKYGQRKRIRKTLKN